jgi:DNA-binding transcriptional ArsR family regulator
VHIPDHDARRSSSPALARLVGRTRAAVLFAARTRPTTSELAQRVGISAASASEHATVLREAGLITTHRHRNTVRHTLTRIGVDLLRVVAPRAVNLTIADRWPEIRTGGRPVELPARSRAVLAVDGARRRGGVEDGGAVHLE